MTGGPGRMTSAADNAREEARGRVSEASFVAARAADAKQGEDTVVLAMSDTLGVTDAFVITSGRNTRQVRTIVDEVERAVKAESGYRHLSASRVVTTSAGS